MSLSLKGMLIAAAVLKALSFMFVALMNSLFPPYGGAFLAMMTSVYPGYDPTTGPLSIIVGSLYALAAGALAGVVFGGVYNAVAENRRVP